MQALLLRTAPGERDDGPTSRPYRLRRAYESLVDVFNRVGFELPLVPGGETPEDASVTRRVFVIPGAIRRSRRPAADAFDRSSHEEEVSSVVVTYGVDDAGRQHLAVIDGVKDPETATVLPYPAYAAIGRTAEELADCVVSEVPPEPQLDLEGIETADADALRVAM